MSVSGRTRPVKKTALAGVWISAPELASRMGVSQNTIWRWARTKRMPAPAQLSPGCTRWRLDQIERWEREKTPGQLAVATEH